VSAAAAIKRHPLYRRIHCHLEDTCPLDGWVDDASATAFVLYPLHSHGARRAAGFAVSLTYNTVLAAKLLVDLREGLATDALESLPACRGWAEQHPSDMGPASGLDPERALRTVLES
jgi:hypothetical protein